VITFLIEGAARSGYNAERPTVSTLSLGPWGWIQIVNFVLTGILMTLFAAGLRRVLHPGPGSAWGPALVTAYGAGLVLAGVFVTDPDPEPGQIIHHSWHGIVHDLTSLPVFLGLSAACLVIARRFLWCHRAEWAAYSLFTAVAIPALFVATSAASPDVTGLIQRITIVTGWAWITTLAIALLARPAIIAPASQQPQGPPRPGPPAPRTRPTAKTPPK
jgi:hypothetical membrane protein